MSEYSKAGNVEDDGPQFAGLQAPEPNFPSYDNPAGTIPGQRKGFTDAQLALVERVREARRGFVALLHEAGGTSGGQNDRLGSADLSLALRHVQDAEYRAIRHITGGPKD